MNNYQNSSHYYDAFTSEISHYDIKLYLDHILSGMNILEVGCGTGRVSLAIAKEIADCRIDAFDISEAMLAHFKIKREKISDNLKSDVNIFNADIANYRPDHKYDLIIFPQQVFQVVVTEEDKIEYAMRYRSMFTKGDKMIISLVDPRIEGKKANESISMFCGVIELPNGERAIKFIEDAVFDETERIFKFRERIQLYDKLNIKREEVIDDFKLAYYTPDIAREVFANAKCTILQELVNPFIESRNFNYFDDMIYILN